MKLFSKIFGKGSRRSAEEQQTARHRAGAGPDGWGGVPGARQGGEQPQYREHPQSAPGEAGRGRAEAARAGGFPAGGAAVSVDPAGGGRIGFDTPSTSSTGSGFGPDPYASGGVADEMRQESTAMVCSRCGQQVSQSSRFCSNCGAPLRAGMPEGPSEQTSTLNIANLEAYEGEGTSTSAAAPLPPEMQAAIDALPANSALLVVRRGPNSGSRFLLDADLTTAGRHPNSEIFLDDVTVSRRHVEFRRLEGGGFSVADVGSLNGTYVNRERIDQAVLTGGDEVQIGKYRLVFFVSPRNL